MSRPFLDDEIRGAMFDIANYKSPGPYGLIVEFFKYHWELVGVYIMAGVHHFFRTGYILKEWNNTFLVLLHKVHNPKKCYTASTNKLM